MVSRGVVVAVATAVPGVSTGVAGAVSSVWVAVACFGRLVDRREGEGDLRGRERKPC